MTKVLILDDEQDIVSFMKYSLQDHGYEVLTAYNNEEALQLLAREPELIILDVMMSGMDGFELCDMIRKHIDCPIIFLSARGREEDRIKGLLVGDDDYLVKPFSMRIACTHYGTFAARTMENEEAGKTIVFRASYC